MFPDLNEFMVKEHQKWLEEQARQIALRKKYGSKKSFLMKYVLSNLIKFVSILI